MLRQNVVIFPTDLQIKRHDVFQQCAAAEASSNVPGNITSKNQCCYGTRIIFCNRFIIIMVKELLLF